MFHTVANTTTVLNQLATDRVGYSRKELSYLSPYMRENINRYGVFDLSRRKESIELEFNIKGE